MTAVTTIRPASGFSLRWFREVWAHRELLFFLVWRDVKIRYRQTAFGAGWAVLQPLLMMAVFAVVFGRLARIPSDGVPYPVFAYTALVPWIFFSQALGGAANSLVDSAGLVSKVYFPRVVVPLAKVGSYLLDLLISSLLVLGMAALYGQPLGWRLLWLPAFALLAVVLAAALGSALAAVNVRYRDVRYAVPFLIQVWLFASPVVYPASLIPAGWRWLYWLNPMAGVVEGFRWAVLRVPLPPGGPLALSVLATVLLLAAAMVYFQRVERTFADVI